MQGEFSRQEQTEKHSSPWWQPPASSFRDHPRPCAAPWGLRGCLSSGPGVAPPQTGGSLL